MVGTMFAHYRILAKLGEGGMGVVYKAEDLKLKRFVALKLLSEPLSRETGAIAQLEREAQVASALNHPHICTVHEAGDVEGQAYIAMEYVEGRTLKVLVARGALPVELVVRYGSQVADALAHAQGRGVTHRDLKSANVVITPEGQVKVLDFGLARRWPAGEPAEGTQSTETLVNEGTIAGTLSYMAPEVLSGKPADARSDLWALGVVLYEMAAGQLPFRGQSGYELSSMILRDPPAPLPAHVPAGLRAVISRLLAKEPGWRYQSAGETRAALEAVGQSWHDAPRLTTAPVAHRPRLAVTVALAALIVVLVALAVVFNLRRFPRTHIESLAVLPLANLSNDPEQEYFVDGMTDAVIADLAKIKALKVISRTSVMPYKSSKKSMRQIAGELQADAYIHKMSDVHESPVEATAKSRAAAMKALELDESLAEKGDSANAISEAEKATRLNDAPLLLTSQASAYALAGRRADSIRVLRQLEEISKHQGPAPAWHGTPSRYVCPYEVAGVYAQLGDRESAFKWLDRAYQSRSCLYWLRQDPRFDSIHSDPRYQELLTRIKFPQ